MSNHICLAEILFENLKKNPATLWQLLALGGVRFNTLLDHHRQNLLASFVPNTLADWERFIKETERPLGESFESDYTSVIDLLMKREVWQFPGILEKVIDHYSQKKFMTALRCSVGSRWIRKDPEIQLSSLEHLTAFEKKLIGDSIKERLLDIVETSVRGAFVEGVYMQWFFKVPEAQHLLKMCDRHAITPFHAYGKLIALEVKEYLTRDVLSLRGEEAVLDILIGRHIVALEKDKEKICLGFYAEMTQSDSFESTKKAENLLKQLTLKGLEKYWISATLPVEAAKEGLGSLRI